MSKRPLLRKLGMPQFGALPSGLAAERIVSSPQFMKGKAQNFMPTSSGEFLKMAPVALEFVTQSVERVPKIDIPIIKPNLDAATRHERGVHVTWLGHSSMLLNIDGVIVLTDPVFSKRTSPFQFSGPARFHDVPLTVDSLPPIDVVLISHDHFDHLDYQTVKTLGERGHRFVTSLGVGDHLRSWGIEDERITELDWWEELEVGSLTIAATPARHFSGRTSAGQNPSLWSSWAFVGEHSRAWFSGDTGLFDPSEIKKRYGSFDLTLIEAGAYHEAWGDVHLGPEGSITLHERLGAKTWMPVHWGTFNLALHAWDDPIVKAQKLAEERNVSMMASLAGDTLRAHEPRVDDFWKERRRLFDER